MEAYLLKSYRLVIVLFIVLLILSPAQLAFGKQEEKNNQNKEKNKNPNETDQTTLYEGTWVTFSFNESSGEISDFIWNGTLLFLEITFSSFTYQRSSETKDGFEIQASEILLEIFDSQQAPIIFSSKKELDVSILLPTDAAVVSSAQSIFIDWTVVSGTLQIGTSGALAVEDSTIICLLTKGTNPTFDLDTSSSSEKDVTPNNEKDKDKDKPDKKPEDLSLGTYSGRYLDFEYNLSAEILKNVSVYDVRLFDQLFIENGSFNKEKVLNNLYKGDGDNASLKAHDNPLCLIQIKASDYITVHLNLTNGWTIIQTNSNITLHNNSNKINVSLRLLGKPYPNSFKILNSNISIILEKSSKIHIHVSNISTAKGKNNTPGVFWFYQTKLIVFSSIDSEYFGGDATIIGPWGEPQIDVFTYIEDFDFEIERIETENTKLTFVVSSEDPTGKFFLVSLLKETFGIPDDAEVKVLMDGQPVPLVSTASALDKDTAGYYRIYDDEGEQLLISIPHFSEHRFTIQFIKVEPDTETLMKVWGYWDFVAIICMLIVILIAALHLYTARKE